jgi:YD repeat-containing protein
MSQMFEVVIRASGEVRDADGNLVSTTDAELTRLRLTEAELRSTNLTDDQIEAIKRGEQSWQ